MAVLHSSEGSGSSLVAFPARLCEEDIEFLIVDTLGAKFPGLCLDGGEVLLKGVENLTVADVLLAEDRLVLLFALLRVVLSEVTSESHGCVVVVVVGRRRGAKIGVGLGLGGCGSCGSGSGVSGVSGVSDEGGRWWRERETQDAGRAEEVGWTGRRLELEH